MKVDPLLERFLPQIAGSVDDIAPRDIHGERAAERSLHLSLVGNAIRPIPAGIESSDHEIGGPDPAHPVRVRVYRPSGTRDGAGAALLFAHGGGWATGSITVADEHCGQIAHASGATVISVEYRLVPEHPFPAGLDDFRHALAWSHANSELLHIDPRRLAVGGESAGGNLAAATAIAARDHGGPFIALQLLEAPVLDLTGRSSSLAACRADARFAFLADAADRILERYVGEPGVDPDQALVSPLSATDFRGLPAAVVLSCEIDPALDDSLRYVAALRAAGVEACGHTFPGLIHGTSQLTGLLPSARQWVMRLAAGLGSI